jgi:hypothetical protein
MERMFCEKNLILYELPSQPSSFKCLLSEETSLTNWDYIILFLSIFLMICHGLRPPVSSDSKLINLETTNHLNVLFFRLGQIFFRNG